MKVSEPNALDVIGAARSLLALLVGPITFRSEERIDAAAKTLREMLDDYDYQVEEFAAREALD